MLGIVPAAGYIFSQPIGVASGLAPFLLLGGSAFGALVAYVFGVSVLDWFYPWKKLVIEIQILAVSRGAGKAELSRVARRLSSSL
jgi:hypothetical protein